MATFNNPFTMLVSGATSSGKTEFVKRLLIHRDKLIYPKPNKILYCYGEITPSIVKLRLGGTFIHQGFPTEEQIKNLGEDSLIILDDLMIDIPYNLPLINKLFTRGSHHWKASVILITQNLFNKELRLLKNNTHYLVLMRNPQALHQIRVLASQMYPTKPKHFIESFEDATLKPYNYLLVDSHPQTLEQERLSTNIFPDEKRIYYVSI